MAAVYVAVGHEGLGTLGSRTEEREGNLLVSKMEIVVRKARREDVLFALSKFNIKAQTIPFGKKQVKIVFEASRDIQDELQSLLDALAVHLSGYIEDSDNLCESIPAEYRF